MDHAELIARFGYIATFAGTILEGESLLILSGLAAHRGYLSFPWVVAVGAVGGALGDLAFFCLGRYYGSGLVDRFPRYAPVVGRIHRMIERYPAATILGVRFMYGLRTAGPAIIGTARVSVARFAALNAIGAVVWSACWAGAGWVLGRAAEHFLGDLGRIERELFAVAIVVVLAGVLGFHAWRLHARRTATPSSARK